MFELASGIKAPEYLPQHHLRALLSDIRGLRVLVVFRIVVLGAVLEKVPRVWGALRSVNLGILTRGREDHFTAVSLPL